MKKREILKIPVGVALVIALVVGLPLMAGCWPAPPEEVVTPPPAEVVTPPEAKVITAKIGFNAPLSGPSAGWALPGLYGNEIWAEHLNAAGGFVTSDGTHVLVEMVPYDNEYSVEKAIAGAKKLIFDDEVVIIQHLAGAPPRACQPTYTEHQIISTTLTPGDMGPEYLYLTAPVETHPLYVVAYIEWVTERYPWLKTIALTTQDEPMGRCSMAAHVGAARAHGIEVVYQKFFDMETVDFAPIVSDILASNPDIVAWPAAFPDFVTLILEQLYLQGYEGFKCGVTLDFYWDIIDRTSAEFMEGTVWPFPDFDDPALTPSPNPYCTIQPMDFWDEYNEKYPGTWSAVSWEYCDILDVWKQGVIYSNSIESIDVFEAWKAMPTIYNTWGESAWWGREWWGIDNALVGPWPVVEMQNEKGVIVGFGDQLAWWDKYGDIMVEANEESNEMWYQVMGISKEEAMAQYPEAFE